MKRADWREYRNLSPIRPSHEGCIMHTVSYEGRRTEKGCVVWRVARGMKTQLHTRTDLWNHSPTGFEWGYGGSGPAQLALALLADALKDDDRAIELHQAFKWTAVTKMAKDHWELTQMEVRDWALQHDQELADQANAAREAFSPVDLGQEDDQ